MNEEVKEENKMTTHIDTILNAFKEKGNCTVGDAKTISKIEFNDLKFKFEIKFVFENGFKATLAFKTVAEAAEYRKALILMRNKAIIEQDKIGGLK